MHGAEGSPVHLDDRIRRRCLTSGVWSGDVADGSVDPQKASRVFVVFGRNSTVQTSMFSFLQALGLRPIEWEQAVARTGKGSPYIGEVLDAAFNFAQAVVILMTPDDVAYLDPRWSAGDGDPETSPRGQARPNVLFEAGMAMGRDQDHAIIVEVGDLRPFSDVGGRHAIRMDGSPQRRKALAQRLDTAGCEVDMSGDHWLTVGDFTAPVVGGGVPLGRRVPKVERPAASVDGRWIKSGGTRLDEIKVTNTGSADLLDVQVVVPPTAEGVQIYQDEPVKRLPPGKTFTIRGHGPWGVMSGPMGMQFDLIVEAHLEDGTPFSDEIFMDAG
jgi:predicted nucleotide-binding protein